MVRSGKWISLAVGALLTWQTPLSEAQVLVAPGQPASSRVARANSRYAPPSQTSSDESADDNDDSDPNQAADDELTPIESDADDCLAPEQENTEVIKERYPDGSVRIEREVTQDSQGNYVNDGIWKTWDQRGNLVAQGEFRHNNRIGTWIRWYRSVTEAPLLTKLPYQQFAGPFISQATFNNDQLDGVWTIYDGKKHKISEWEFASGQRHGSSTWWHANGRKMREIQFRDGDIDGELIEWSPDGSVLVKEVYQAGRKLAPKTAYHSGDKKKSEGIYLFAKNVEQTPDDWWNCKMQVTTKQGKDEKHGRWTSWFANGQRQLEGSYEHDLQVGPFTWWHSNGQKALEGKFEDGKQDGAWTWWYPSGQKSIRGDYAHGTPTGRWTWWKEDGKVAQSADLSHSEGVVVETPRAPDADELPQVTKQPARNPVKR